MKTYTTDKLENTQYVHIHNRFTGKIHMMYTYTSGNQDTHNMYTYTTGKHENTLNVHIHNIVTRNTHYVHIHNGLI